jgi:ABC-type transport system involved in multi-copper enzyme maturation permease subunit
MITPPPLPEPIPTATPSWQRALGGIWRLTYRRFLAPQQLGILAGLLGLLGLLALAGVHNGNAEHFAQWSVHFYLTFVVPVIAFLSAAGLIQDDMKSATADYVLTRPVRRHAFVLHRYLAHTACLQVQCLLALGVLVAVGMFRQVPELASTAPSLLLAQVLGVAAFSALGFAFGAYTSRYLILGIFYAGVIEVGIGNIPTQLNRLSMTHHVRTIASSILHLRSRGTSVADSLPASLGTLLVLSLLLVAVAAVFFSVRETAGTKPKDA